MPTAGSGSTSEIDRSIDFRRDSIGRPSEQTSKPAGRAAFCDRVKVDSQIEIRMGGIVWNTDVHEGRTRLRIFG